MGGAPAEGRGCAGWPANLHLVTGQGRSDDRRAEENLPGGEPPGATLITAAQVHIRWIFRQDYWDPAAGSYRPGAVDVRLACPPT